MTDRELIDRLLFLAQTAVDQALNLDYDDPEDFFIYRELRELKTAVAALAETVGEGPTDDELLEAAAKALGYKSIPSDETCLTAEAVELLTFARATLARWGTPNLAQVRSSLGDGPSDIELLQLMPEPMRDEFSYAAKVCSDVTGGQVKPGIFRVTLNTAALEYARAVLARWGHPAAPPAPEAP